jgi:AcrR family transcriptional regulator
MEPTLPPSPGATPVPSRVRRGNRDDHRRLQAAVVSAAFELFQQGGTEAITMQALASSLGRSAMSLYRYFENKQAVLQELWRVVYAELLLEVRSRVERHSTPAQRHRALVESFLAFWESRPDYYQLVYRTSGNGLRIERPMPEALMPSYGDVITLAATITRELADELGTGHERITLAAELRVAFMMGYLQARFANPRYPWQDFEALRELCIESILASVVQCLTDGHAEAPSPPSRPA